MLGSGVDVHHHDARIDGLVDFFQQGETQLRPEKSSLFTPVWNNAENEARGSSVN
jgi:hypothetical protein